MRRLFSLLLTSTLSVVPAVALATDDCAKAFDDGSDQTSAAECLSSAVAGDSKAQFGYGQLLAFAPGREHKRQESVDWFRRAAKQHHTLAQVVLGRILSDNEFGLPLNEVEAFAWWWVANEKTSATKLWTRMTPEQRNQAKRLAAEYTSYSSLSK
jgi:TPR repeat protein